MFKPHRLSLLRLLAPLPLHTACLSSRVSLLSWEGLQGRTANNSWALPWLTRLLLRWRSQTHLGSCELWLCPEWQWRGPERWTGSGHALGMLCCEVKQLEVGDWLVRERGRGTCYRIASHLLELRNVCISKAYHSGWHLVNTEKYLLNMGTFEWSLKKIVIQWSSVICPWPHNHLLAEWTLECRLPECGRNWFYVLFVVSLISLQIFSPLKAEAM